MAGKVCWLCLVSVLLILAPTLCAAQVGGAGADEAVAYLKTRQNSDGGFSEPGAGSDEKLTCWAVLAGKAAGEDPLSWSNSGDNTYAYLTRLAGTVTGLEDIEMFTLALAEGGADPRSVQGRNMVALLNSHVKESGQIGKTIKEQCLGILALAGAGEDVSAKVTGWLVSRQREDGAWGEKDEVIIEDTALAVEALIAVEEVDGDILGPALKFLRDRINPDGGFMGVSKVSDAQLTATVIRAITAAGSDPSSTEWSFHGNDPEQFLSSLQAPDGHFQFSKGTESQPTLTTSVALPALMGKHFPLAASAGNVSFQEKGPRVLHDLGTAGVNMRAGSQPVQSVPKEEQVVSDEISANSSGGVSAGASGKRTSWFNGFWLFLMVGLAYAVILTAVVVVVSRLTKPHETA